MKPKSTKQGNGFYFWAHVGIAIATLLMAIASLIPLAPAFIKLLVKYPSLDTTLHLTGTIEIEPGRRTFKGKKNIDRYYVVSPDGRNEIKYGYLGERFSPLNGDNLNGAEGEVWYHPLFGVVQQELRYISRRGEIETSKTSIEEIEAWHMRFDWSRYLKHLWLPGVLLLALVLQVRRLRRKR